MNYEDIGEREIKAPVRAVMVGKNDNVALLLSDVKAGEAISINGYRVEIAQEDIPAGHRISARFLPAGQPVITYGQVIGLAARAIQPGERIHSHNLDAS